MAAAAAAAAAMGMMSGSSSSSMSWIRHNDGMRKMMMKNEHKTMKVRMSCVASLTDKFKTLKVDPGASESDVKKAFRRLALQYHPDVCKGNNCGVEFHHINEAYDVVMSYLRGETQDYGLDNSSDQEEVFVYDDSDMWEEWMGWEGAGIRDYTSHINPYI